MKKKLILNKERITELTKEQYGSIKGGQEALSTEHNFTCNWCTSNTNDNTCMDTCGESAGAHNCPPFHTVDC